MNTGEIRDKLGLPVFHGMCLDCVTPILRGLLVCGSMCRYGRGSTIIAAGMTNDGDQHETGLRKAEQIAVERLIERLENAR